MTAAVLALCVLTGWAVVRMQRSLDQPGGREGLGTSGDAFNLVDEIFHPAQARATRDLKEYEEKREVAPSPDDDEDAPVVVLRRPDGSPRAVRVRRPRG